MNEEILSDEQVKVFVSICPKCEAYIRIAIKHLMTAKTRKDFMDEVIKYELSVKVIPLLEYRNSGTSFCKCKIKVK